MREKSITQSKGLKEFKLLLVGNKTKASIITTISTFYDTRTMTNLGEERDKIVYKSNSKIFFEICDNFFSQIYDGK